MPAIGKTEPGGIGILGLHGSSGHPDLIDEFTRSLAPHLPRSSPRGTIVDGEGYTFFKRCSDRSIPSQEVLALARASLDSGGCVADSRISSMLIMGYSSGAVFAAALLAVAPALFAGAILLRPQPISDDFLFPSLAGKPVLVISGMHDNRREPRHALRVAEQLSLAGADVVHRDLDTGHAWTAQDLALSRDWLKENFSDLL